MRFWLVHQLVLLLIITNATPVILRPTLEPATGRKPPVPGPATLAGTLQDNTRHSGSRTRNRRDCTPVQPDSSGGGRLCNAGNERGPFLQLYQAPTGYCLQPLSTAAGSITGNGTATLGHAGSTGGKRRRNSAGDRAVHRYRPVTFPAGPARQKTIDSSGTVQMMQCYLGRTIKTDIDNTGPGTGRGIPRQAMIGPGTRT